MIVSEIVEEVEEKEKKNIYKQKKKVFKRCRSERHIEGRRARLQSKKEDADEKVEIEKAKQTNCRKTISTSDTKRSFETVKKYLFFFVKYDAGALLIAHTRKACGGRKKRDQKLRVLFLTHTHASFC